MRTIKPHYFDSFQCVADKCPDSCCAGWQIVIDEDSLNRYADESGEYGRKMADRVDWGQESFRQYNGRCACLDESNLCKLVIEKGEEYLCNTCHRYPRHEEEFADLREWSLSLSCPIAAEMMLLSDEKVKLLVEEDEEPDPLEEEFEDFDYLLFTKLEDAREVMLNILQNRTVSMDVRMEKILGLAAQMQEALEEDKLYEMDEMIAAVGSSMVSGNSEEQSVMVANQYTDMKNCFQIFRRLEPLREEWQEILGTTEETLYANESLYLQIQEEFHRAIGSEERIYEDWECFRENLMFFFLYTYFCGAVYDDWIYSKVAMAVFSVKFISEFIMCRWFLTDKEIGGKEKRIMDKREWVKLAYQYAREVEHSDDNLNLLEEWLHDNPFV